MLVDPVPGFRGDRACKGILTELWRERDLQESLRLQRKAAGVSEDDLEDPLPEGVLEGLFEKFAASYNFRLALEEQLCEPLIGRLNREIERKTNPLVPIERVRNARGSARTAAGKRPKVGSDMTLSLGGAGLHKGPRDVSYSFVYVALLEVLLVGGYAAVRSGLRCSAAGIT